MIVFILVVALVAIALSLCVRPLLLADGRRWDAGAEERAAHWALVHAIDGKLLISNGFGFDIIESRHVKPGTAIIIDSGVARPVVRDEPIFGFVHDEIDPWPYRVETFYRSPIVDPNKAFRITGI